MPALALGSHTPTPLQPGAASTTCRPQPCGAILALSQLTHKKTKETNRSCQPVRQRPTANQAAVRPRHPTAPHCPHTTDRTWRPPSAPTCMQQKVAAGTDVLQHALEHATRQGELNAPAQGGLQALKAERHDHLNAHRRKVDRR